jgi:AAA15 family ATPase/GTPase
LKKRIYSERLPPSFNRLDYSVENIKKMLSQSILDPNKCATFSNERLKIIAKYKYDMMTLTIRIAEEMVRSHAEIIANEKKKLIDMVANGQVPLPKALVSISNAIAAAGAMI